MSLLTIRQFVFSVAAWQIHLLFGGVAILLLIGLIGGGGPPDALPALIFCVVAHPIVLVLRWWQIRSDQKAAVQHVVDSETRPSEYRRQRQIMRAIILPFLFAVACGIIWLGFQGWVVNDTIPAQYLGYGLLIFACAGLAGFNIWIGGPLDMRNDPTPSEDHNAT